MKTVYHPKFAGVVRDVKPGDVAEWLTAGWLEKPPSKNPAHKAHKKPSGEPVDAIPTDENKPEGTPA